MNSGTAVRRIAVIVGLLACALAKPLSAVAIQQVDSCNACWGIAFTRWNGRFTAGASDVGYRTSQFIGFQDIGATDLRAIAAALDGTVWITEPYAGRIWHFNLATGIATYIPVSGQPWEITIGSDGNPWFTEFDGNKIGRINPDGSLSEFTVPTAGSGPSGITLGGDGNIWFTEFNGNKVGRVTPKGVFHEIALGTAGACPTEIASSGSQIAVVEVALGQIAFINIQGELEIDQPIPTPGAAPQGIAYGSDGAFWFVEYYGNKIGRAQSGSPITEFPITTPGSGPRTITAGPDGGLWFTMQNRQAVGHVVLHLAGDLNADGVIDVADVFYLIDYLFAGGPVPQ